MLIKCLSPAGPAVWRPPLWRCCWQCCGRCWCGWSPAAQAWWAPTSYWHRRRPSPRPAPGRYSVHWWQRDRTWWESSRVLKHRVVDWRAIQRCGRFIFFYQFLVKKNTWLLFPVMWAGFGSLNNRDYWIMEMFHSTGHSQYVTAHQKSANVMVVNKIITRQIRLLCDYLGSWGVTGEPHLSAATTTSHHMRNKTLPL